MVLQENDIEALKVALSASRASYNSNHEAIQRLLVAHEKLITAYAALKSDYEEEKETREKYKKLARYQDRHAYVLVLIDGDGYAFNDNLASREAEGGAKAAQLLREAVISQLSPEERNLSVFCKVYTDLKDLSVRLSHAKIGKAHSRAAAPFAAAFTRSQATFDFIDCGDGVDNAHEKIIETLRQCVSSTQCKRIFLACTHRSEYLESLKAMLQRYPERHEQVTLIGSPSYSREFESLRLPIVDFKSVFRSSPLPPVPTKLAAFDSTRDSTRYENGQGSDISRYSTPGPPLAIPKPANNGLRYPNVVAKWDNVVQPTGPTLAPKRPGSSLRSVSRHSATTISEQLPRPSDQQRGLIPLNQDGYRIDTYLPPLSREALRHYKQRPSPLKACNDFHLRSLCPKGPGCPYDHQAIDESSIQTMRTLVRTIPCTRGSYCRDVTCVKGHHCQSPYCDGAVKNPKCRMPRAQHIQDVQPVEWVSPDNEPTYDSETIIDVNENMEDLWVTSEVADAKPANDLSPLDASFEMTQSNTSAKDLSVVDGPGIWGIVSPNRFAANHDLWKMLSPDGDEENGNDDHLRSTNGGFSNGSAGLLDDDFVAPSTLRNGRTDLWDQPLPTNGHESTNGHANGNLSRWDTQFADLSTPKSATPVNGDHADSMNGHTNFWRGAEPNGNGGHHDERDLFDSLSTSASPKYNGTGPTHKDEIDDTISENSFVASPIRETFTRKEMVTAAGDDDD